ncbi:unnamed protein product [Rangifer tarandus platyrhynchus]|uniref:Uncharacterized protein n=1 Tax=Rangifer tarandus platyrhynchus TaxID=3082113 RepID=A0AC60A1N4_RANTA
MKIKTGGLPGPGGGQENSLTLVEEDRMEEAGFWGFLNEDRGPGHEWCCFIGISAAGREVEFSRAARPARGSRRSQVQCHHTARCRHLESQSCEQRFCTRPAELRCPVGPGTSGLKSGVGGTCTRHPMSTWN